MRDLSEYEITRPLEPAEYKPNTAEGVIVEVGFGWTPFTIYSWELVNKMRKGALYVGIDSDADVFLRTSEAGLWIQGDLSAIPLPSTIADEVWLINVFGRMDDYDPELPQYCHELSRILKSEGKIIIGENNTPAHWLRRINFSEFGLLCDDFVSDDVVGYREFSKFTDRNKITRGFLSRCDRSSDVSFFMTLTKEK